MSELQKEIFDFIAKNDINELKKKLSSYNGSIDFTDENGKHKISLEITEKLPIFRHVSKILIQNAFFVF